MKLFAYAILIILPTILLGSYEAFSSVETDALLVKLKQEFARSAHYDQQKEAKIRSLRTELQQVDSKNIDGQFDVCLKLYDEYKSYKYDSAYVYADRLHALSLKAGNNVKENYSKIKLAFILLSAGKYKEAFTIAETIDHKGFNEFALGDYYSVMTRANFDLAAYNNDAIYSPKYRSKGNLYLDSAIQLSKVGSYSRLFLTSYRNFSRGNNDAAIRDFLNLAKIYKSATHEDAITSSILSELYMRTNDTEKATIYLIRAVIGDLQASTKETSAIFNLAELTSKSGDANQAYLYIQQALKDAAFYGARQRQIKISTVLPLITAQKLNFIESENTRFFVYLCSTLLLALLIIIISILLYKQLQQRKAKEKIIAENNANLELMNNQLLEVNNQVVKANHQLAEDAHIKEEYIGYFFNLISGYILKLEKLKTSINAKLIQNKLEQIKPIINEIEVDKEREILFETFDKVFLKIFPNFLISFNSLFKTEDQIWPKDNEILTTDLRIFALTRLGIDETESISKILQYSAKTIYVYKMRLKAKSIYQAAEFDERLMNIKAIEGLPKADLK